METLMATDEQLILEFQKGSREAFSELFLRYRELIYAFFRRRVKDAARAEELAQETFVAILRGIQRYEPRATFRTYLFGIAYKILANDRRKLDQNSGGAGSGFDSPDPSAPGNAETGMWVRAGDRKARRQRSRSAAAARIRGIELRRNRRRAARAAEYSAIAAFPRSLALKEILVSVPSKSARKENALDSSF